MSNCDNCGSLDKYSHHRNPMGGFFCKSYKLKSPLPLAVYTIKIMPPEGRDLTNKLMDDALATANGTIGHTDYLQRLIDGCYIKGVDALGCEGFTVVVEKE